MSTQNIELVLIQRDIGELCSIMLALPNHKFSGYLALALFPTICFVTEESHNYLVSRNIKNDSSILFDSYNIAIKKS